MMKLRHLVLSLAVTAGCSGTSPDATTTDGAADAPTDTAILSDAPIETASDARDGSVGRDAPAEGATGAFACGPKTCTYPAEYCLVSSGGPAGSTTTYECKPAPTECAGVATCACIDPSLKSACGTSPGSTACKVRDGGIEASCLRA